MMGDYSPYGLQLPASSRRCLFFMYFEFGCEFESAAKIEISMFNFHGKGESWMMITKSFSGDHDASCGCSSPKPGLALWFLLEQCGHMKEIT